MGDVTWPELPRAKTPTEFNVAGRRQLIGLTPAELAAWTAELGHPRFRARQIFRWLHAAGVKSFAEMTDLPAALRTQLAEVATPVTMEQETAQTAGVTRTAKYLYRLTADQEKVESVLMAHDYGWSACVSSQVGCRMGCAFCASTFGGLVRNLTAAEIVDQIIMMQHDMPADQRIGSVVIMGSGEPLENYENVVKSIRLMHEPDGLNIGYRHITVSTSGLPAAMRRLAGEDLPVTLALSLHAPNDELRSRLMPVNRVWPVVEVVAAARHYAEVTGRRVTIEYLLIAGLNDNPEQAVELGRLLSGLLVHINLIPLNPVAERPEFRRPSADRVRRFRDLLGGCGLTATIRREMGGDIDAACGQLRNRATRRGRRTGIANDGET